MIIITFLPGTNQAVPQVRVLIHAWSQTARTCHHAATLAESSPRKLHHRLPAADLEAVPLLELG